MITFDFSHYRNKHWYPGHMLKAIKQIKDKLNLVDIAIVLHDARLPKTSYNPTFDAILKTKGILRIINKCDMIPQEDRTQWKNFYSNKKDSVLFTQLNKKIGIEKLFKKIEQEVTESRQRRGTTRPLLRPVRAMIVGLPNIGKSTLINNIKKSKAAKAGPYPGVTRHQQWVKYGTNIEFLDTPGIMHPQGTGSEQELRLGLANIIRRDIIGEDIICHYLLYLLHLNSKHNALKIYGLTALPETIEEIFVQICKKRGFLLNDGQIDHHKASSVLLRDYDDGKLPKLIFELPNDIKPTVIGLQALFHQNFNS